MGRRRKYIVTGPLRVHEVKTGDTLELDPSEPETERLLARGQIAVASTRQSDTGGSSTDGDPGKGSSEQSKE